MKCRICKREDFGEVNPERELWYHFRTDHEAEWLKLEASLRELDAKIAQLEHEVEE